LTRCAAGGPVARTRGLTVRLRSPQHTTLVDSVDLDVRAGCSVGIVGESGSGKSLTLRALLGVLPAQFSVTGQVSIYGEDGTAVAGRHRRVGFVPQDSGTGLNPVLTVGAHLAEALDRRPGTSRAERRRAAAELLDEVGLTDPIESLRRYPHQLSGGMRQRVLIACALAARPALLLADEPTTALDVTVQAEILTLLRREQQERGTALLLVSHDIDVVRFVADEIIVMYSGRVVERAPAQRLVEAPRMHYTRGLLDAVPRLTDPVDRPLRPIPGSTPAPQSRPPGCPFAPRCPAAQSLCTQKAPPLTADADGSEFACWFPLQAAVRTDPRQGAGRLP
jgi:peptide/nickel transport system permease protein